MKVLLSILFDNGVSFIVVQRGLRPDVSEVEGTSCGGGVWP